MSWKFTNYLYSELIVYKIYFESFKEIHILHKHPALTEVFDTSESYWKGIWCLSGHRGIWVVRADLCHFTYLKLIFTLWMHTLSTMEQLRSKMRFSTRHQDVPPGTYFILLTRRALTTSNILRTWLMKILLCNHLRKNSDKMDPKQGSWEGSNSIFLHVLNSKSDSFSREVLPEMEVEDLSLRQNDKLSGIIFFFFF